MADPDLRAFLRTEWNKCITDENTIYYKVSKNTRRRRKKKAVSNENRDCETLMEYIHHTWSLHCRGLPASTTQEKEMSHNAPHYKGFLPLDDLLEYINSGET